MNKVAIPIESLQVGNKLKLKDREEYFPILDFIKVQNEIASISCFGFVVDRKVFTRMFESTLSGNLYIYN